MSKRPRSEGGRTVIGGELILPVAGLIFTLYYFSTILDSPWEAQVAAFFVGSILIALIFIFLVKTGLALARGEARFDLKPLVAPLRINLKRLALFGLTLGYVLLIPYLGFTITTFVFMASAMFLLQQKKRLLFAIVLSAVISLLGYLLFIVAFETRFPRGPFEELMRGIF
ncbi:MAG: tripartite tricarboxylate transporter TctB family protein [Hyphomicrobiales bacterium]|nr:tripartite tricarboxylate transporter TctB family protein [Hyphomicrobiales bacterium]